jgi:hypothetical protein
MALTKPIGGVTELADALKYIQTADKVSEPVRLGALDAVMRGPLVLESEYDTSGRLIDARFIAVSFGATPRH